MCRHILDPPPRSLRPTRRRRHIRQVLVDKNILKTAKTQDLVDTYFRVHSLTSRP
jgi:hypothetical protein